MREGRKAQLEITPNALGERGGGAAREAPGGEPRRERRLLQRLSRTVAPPPPGRRRRCLPSAVVLLAVERGGDRVAERRVEPQPRPSVKDAAGEGRAEAVVKGPRALCGEERGRRLYLSVFRMCFVFFVLARAPFVSGRKREERTATLEEKEREREGKGA